MPGGGAVELVVSLQQPVHAAEDERFDGYVDWKRPPAGPPGVDERPGEVFYIPSWLLYLNFMP